MDTGQWKKTLKMPFPADHQIFDPLPPNINVLYAFIGGVLLILMPHFNHALHRKELTAAGPQLPADLQHLTYISDIGKMVLHWCTLLLKSGA